MWARIVATLARVRLGVARLPWNWRALVWAQDLRHPPELIPGVARRPELGGFLIGKLLWKWKGESGVGFFMGAAASALTLILWFLPALLFRLSLKSTCWFWWPLAFAQGRGRAVGRKVGRVPEVVLEQQSKSLWAKTLFAAALAILAAAGALPKKLLAANLPDILALDLGAFFAEQVFLLAPFAAVHVAMVFVADHFLSAAKGGVLDAGAKKTFVDLVQIRWALFWGAIAFSALLLLGRTVPGLEPLAAAIEAAYLGWFPLAAFGT